MHGEGSLTEYKIGLRGVQSLGAGVIWDCYSRCQVLFVRPSTLKPNRGFMHAASFSIAMLIFEIWMKLSRVNLGKMIRDLFVYCISGRA